MTDLEREGLLCSQHPTAHVAGDLGTQTGCQLAPRQWGLVWGSQGGGRGPLPAGVGYRLVPL